MSLSVILNIRSYSKIVKGVFLGKDKEKIINEVHKLRYGQFQKPGHESASEIRKYFPNEWSDYFKFCFVRNPFERAVSDYLWRKSKTGSDATFNTFLSLVKSKLSGAEVANNIVPEKPRNWPIYSIDDEIAVDYVGKYENLYSDFREVCDYIGLEVQTNRSISANRVTDYDYRKFYDDKTYELVNDIYRKEIEYFGYDM